MTTEQLPIIYRAKRRQVWIVLALCVVSVAFGIYLIAEGSSQLVGTSTALYRQPRIPAFLLGWLALLLGVIGAALTGLTLLRDRPRLEIRAEGVLQYPRLFAPRGWRWSDIERVEVKRVTRTGTFRDEHYDSVVLVLAGGGDVSILAPEDAETMRDTMMRVKARARAS